MNRYKKLKFVGEGSFARVYKVIDKKTSEIVALKCIKKAGKSETEIDKLMEEIMILQSVSHKNIIKIIEWFVTEQEICVITEFAENGELFKMIKKKSHQLSECDISIIAKQLVSALQFLHFSRIIHRDIKPQNILLSNNNIIKLCDFGFARLLSEESTMATSIKGTPLYMAPELVQEKPYNDKVDLWSLGVILYELYYGKPPFYTNSIYKLVKMIVKDHIKYPLNPPISNEFQHFINGLLQKNPQKRFNIELLHKHPFLMQNNQKKQQKTKQQQTKQQQTKQQQQATTYSDTYLKQIKYQKKNISLTPTPIKNIKSISKEYEKKKNNDKIEEITECKQSSPSISTSTSTSTSSKSTSSSSVISLNKENNKENINNGHTVKQKVLEILDSNDMNMIDKILIILPQRWQSLCSLSNGQNMSFEMKLFNKLLNSFKYHIDNDIDIDIDNKTENMLKNVINVMHLTIDRIQKSIKNDKLNDDFLNDIKYTINYIEKYMKLSSLNLLFPTLCQFIKISVHFNDKEIFKLMMNEKFISLIISQFISFIKSKSNESDKIHKITEIVIDIICELIEYNPLKFYVTNYDTLQLKAFSKISMKEIPIYEFWKNIQHQIYESNEIDLILNNILNQNSKYTLKFIFFLYIISPNMRDKIDNDVSIKKLLILYIYINYLDNNDNEFILDGLLLLYHLNDPLSNTNNNEIQNIENILNKLSNSNDIYISNLSQSILIINHKYLLSDYKMKWQNILSFIQKNNNNDLNDIFFKTPSNESLIKNIFDFWCNTLHFIDIADNIKLSITICLQIFNILTKKIKNIIKNNNPSKNGENIIFIVSAKSLNIFLKFVHKILKILLSETQINTTNINQYQKQRLIKEFLCCSNIETLSILGNPQFILEYISIIPFYIDTLYNDLMECCNMSYSNILLIYRYLTCQYTKQSQSKLLSPSPSPALTKLLSPSPSPALTKFRSYTNHLYINDDKLINNNNNNNNNNELIYNFHKITLEFQLISSILNYIQISLPSQKEQCCNLLFYITWKQSLFMKEFLNNNGLLIVTNCIIKQRKYHSNNIIIQILQIISCTARKYKNFYNKIENTGIFKIIPKLMTHDDDTNSIEIKEKICNLIGNLCKHNDKFLNVIKRENLLKLLCECTENKLSSNIRRFACYAIGNIAYQSTKANTGNTGNNNNSDDLIICIKPLSLRLNDNDYKTQENAAGAIGNLISSNSNNNELIINEIINNNVIKLLLNEIRNNNHLCVIRNCLYSLSNICYFNKCKKSMIHFGWRHILKNCLSKYGDKDQFVKKCTFKILRKMESTKKY